jgi:hypothetical protein
VDSSAQRGLPCCGKSSMSCVCIEIAPLSTTRGRPGATAGSQRDVIDTTLASSSITGWAVGIGNDKELLPRRRQSSRDLLSLDGRHRAFERDAHDAGRSSFAR